ncbi:uncharacterized membrane protein YhaH (DUF805 family) [Microbacterium resistens]|uniref:Uncharacterized membrane protein YhaH (DUF805 family) n=1 Tax=Microbacterium resistens TaxID=156977 RepID=A0ABU1S924_9MICO|nr:DUF805 domain-containing protein [Microbacterium resistens]MDR6866113.1 uncharacterized membrane protein YhaH (DUF805 family) [Microbacterium resistens]
MTIPPPLDRSPVTAQSLSRADDDHHLGLPSHPLPGARPGQAVSRCIERYATFTGRASRSEFWWIALLLVPLGLVPVALIGGGLFLTLAEDGLRVADAPDAVPLLFTGGLLALLIFGATALPSLALAWRRMHDADMPGPLALLGLVPFIGTVALALLALRPSRTSGARFDR